MPSYVSLSMVNSLIGLSTYFIVRLSAQSCSGSVGESDSPPVWLLTILARSASVHSCFVLQGVYQHLGLLFSWILGDVWSVQLLEGFAPFLRVLFFFDVSDIFREVSEVVRNSSSDFLSLENSAWYSDLCLILPLLGGIRSCHSVSIFLRSYLAGFFGFLLFQKGSLFYQGSKLSKGMLCVCETISWKVFSTSYFLVFQRQKRSSGISLLISDCLTLVEIFLLRFVEDEILK